ncbi:hypothetical protein BH23PLA1_BH23PLA1_19440 [soil metagenome]
MICHSIRLTLLLLLPADSISPADLRDFLSGVQTTELARAVSHTLRASFSDKEDLTRGTHLIDGNDVAFVVEAPADGPTPRLQGMVTRQQGRDFQPIGATGLHAIVLEIPTDTKFSYDITVGGEKVGGGTVEMPDWASPPESEEREDQPYGEFQPLTFRSKVFDNDRTGWIYVPAAYDGSEPAALMVFQDGDAYKREHVGTVVENLIADGEMPILILVLLNPGVNDDGQSNRSVEYDTLSDRYATFLAEEVLPRVEADFNLRDDPAWRAIGGASSGGICAFTVAWERPDLFGRVCSHIGSFTNIRGGGAYPEIVRQTEKRPIVKVSLHDGSNDLINRFGDWWEANNRMYEALKDKGYHVDFLTDGSFHSYASAGRVLPETLRRTWAEQD